ncbi:MAG: hypothetical protein KGH60_05305, partial [Candidatus Micrarchaeota archaeon]|nr:hypothetical protein [Candidatus Micrarchaeota archaeon]
GGAGNGQLNFFSGFISNVQMYSTALTSNNVKQLFLEGIGGAPIDTSHLYLWLMLNQNANDTSGNQGYGIANSNTVFVTNWWTGGRYNGVP